MPADLPTRFIDFVRRKKMVATGDRVIVAVSGGVDSIVLLHLFKTTAAQLGIEVIAAHYDHAMRSASADDAAWVARLCAEWKVPLVTERSVTRLRGESAARAARYAFLHRKAQELGARRIATAHHADDQIETIIFRILRGTGLRGLSGIPVRRGAIIRPLLRFRKRTLNAYAIGAALGFREDETNAEDTYARNRIRNRLLPAITSLRPALPKAIVQLSRHAARTERAWRSVLADVEKKVILPSEKGSVALARGTLLEYDAEIRGRVLRRAFRGFGLTPDRGTTDAALRFIEAAGSGARFDAGGGVRIERAYDVLRVTHASKSVVEQRVLIADCGSGARMATIANRRWQVQWSPGDADETGAKFGCDALAFPLEVRGWLPGDRMRMPYGSKKLKKLFAEHRVPVHERNGVPVLVDNVGRVLWAVGVARSIDAPAAGNARALSVTVINAEIS